MNEPISGELASHAGQAIYNPLTLALYDVVVLGLSNPLIWRCATKCILELYDRYATDDHLDVGVGSGWYLDHHTFSHSHPRIGLLDLNPNSLRTAATRIARYEPQTYRADVLAPLTLETAPYASIAMTYLLHCLPGTMSEKSVAFDHVLPLLAPDGCLFGATLLTGGVDRSIAARALMAAYNRRGVFANAHDTLDSLTANLNRRFRDVAIETVGCAGLFLCRTPRREERPIENVDGATPSANASAR